MGQVREQSERKVAACGVAAHDEVCRTAALGLSQVSDELERLAESVDLDGVTFTPWIERTGVRDLPAMADDRPR